MVADHSNVSISCLTWRSNWWWMWHSPACLLRPLKESDKKGFCGRSSQKTPDWQSQHLGSVRIKSLGFLRSPWPIHRHGLRSFVLIINDRPTPVPVAQLSASALEHSASTIWHSQPVEFHSRGRDNHGRLSTEWWRQHDDRGCRNWRRSLSCDRRDSGSLLTINHIQCTEAQHRLQQLEELERKVEPWTSVAWSSLIIFPDTIVHLFDGSDCEC